MAVYNVMLNQDGCQIEYQGQAKPVQDAGRGVELCTKPTAKTQIMHKTNMSYSGMQKFLRHLIEMELVRQEDDGTKYVTTEKGREFVKRYTGLQDLLK